MSDVFEVAFSGEIADGAELDQVKAAIGKMFKADEAKLAQLFSGRRIVIKKNIDEQTAMKYQAAMHKAGARCEVKNLSADVEQVQAAPPPAEPPAAPPPAAAPSPAPAPAPAVSEAADLGHRDIPPAPQTVPLQVSADQIADLGVDLAPVGSDMHEMSRPDAPPPQIPEGITVAPVGSELTEHREEKAPPVPDTSGLSLRDD